MAVNGQVPDAPEEPEIGEEQEQKMRLSPELYALEKILRILEKQSVAGQRRMVNYLVDRYAAEVGGV